MTEKAKAPFSAWSDITTDHINAKEPMAMPEFFQKIKNYAFRISLVLQMMYEVCECKVSSGQVEGYAIILAIVFGNYMLDNSRKIVHLLSLSSDQISRMAFNVIRLETENIKVGKSVERKIKDVTH